MARYSYRRPNRRRAYRRRYRRIARVRVPRRRIPYRRRAFRRVQDTVKYTTKCYDSFGLNWFLPQETVTASDNYARYSRSLTLNAFINGNRQFFRNVEDYTYIKFNYFAIKINELLYIGFDRHYNGGTGGNPIPYSMGVNCVAADKYPMYFAWDVDEKFTFAKDSKSVKVDPKQLTQYEGTKKLFPSSKRPITFLWRVPAPWRQFFPTANLPDWNNYIANFLTSLSGIKTMRYPSTLLGTHTNWWNAALPDDSKSANIYTNVGMTCYMGVTFKGRKTMGDFIKSEAGPEPEMEEVISQPFYHKVIPDKTFKFGEKDDDL